MCWIAYVNKDRSQIPREHLANAHHRNDDGWGLMYAQDGEVVIVKDKGKDHEAFRKAWLEVPEKTPVCVHFRFGTAGSMGSEMAHPFPVLHDENGRCTLAMMHNGVLDCVHEDKVGHMSDTAVLLRDVIIPQLEQHPDLLENETWRWMMGYTIGNPNKLVFMRGDGEVFIVNDYQGKWMEGGVWYSNQYSIDPPIPTKIGGWSGFAGDDDWDFDTTYSRGCVSPTAEKPLSQYNQLMESCRKNGWVFDEKDKRWYKKDNEPIDSMDRFNGGNDGYTFLLDDKDVPKTEEEMERDETLDFLDQVYDMSESEVYNFVANSNAETLTDIIIELATGGSKLYQ